MDEMELNIEKSKEIQKELVTESEQTNFLETNLGKAVNFAMDIGLRAILPNFIEDGIIEIKDTIFREGFGEGIKNVIYSGINLGKSLIGIFTGKFDNVNQMQAAVQKGGIIDGTSDLLDSVLNKIQKEKMMPKQAITAIKEGKDILLSSVSRNIEKTLTKQVEEVEKLDKYSEKWKDYYNERDFKNMEKEYKKIESILKNIIPLEETIRKAREIENLHNLIKNNGNNFDITEEEKELTKRLI